MCICPLENMKYFIFNRESNDFDDILTDNIIKKLFSTKIRWSNHLMVGIPEYGNEGSFSYITLKYGDDMITAVVPDRSPVMYTDYTPKGNEKFNPRTSE